MQSCRRCAVLGYSSAAENYCSEIGHVYIPSESRGQISSHFLCLVKWHDAIWFTLSLAFFTYSWSQNDKFSSTTNLLCFNNIRHRASLIPDFWDKQQVHSVRPLASIPLVYWPHQTWTYLSPVDTHNISIFFQLLIIIKNQTRLTWKVMFDDNFNERR